MQLTEILAVGQDFYIRTFGGPGNRWIDYSGIAVDPWDRQQVSADHDLDGNDIVDPTDFTFTRTNVGQQPASCCSVP